MNAKPPLNHCRVVLVRPTIAANLGATARVMRNLGFTDLVLVAPEADPADPRARQLSTHGEAILEQARIVPDLGQALADCVLVAGTSARRQGIVRDHANAPEQVSPRLVEALAQGPVALVFGPEPSGLSNVEVTRCHDLIHIPTDPGYPALNLAQAIAICLYEVRRAWLADSLPVTPPEPPAPFAEVERMFSHLRTALEEIHFLYGPKADTLLHGLRRLITRARPTPREVKLLFGLARQVRWYVAHHRDAGTAERGAL